MEEGEGRGDLCEKRVRMSLEVVLTLHSIVTNRVHLLFVGLESLQTQERQSLHLAQLRCVPLSF